MTPKKEDEHEHPLHRLEELYDHDEAIRVRRERLAVSKALPHQFSYSPKLLHGCCENVIGHVPVPVGVAGPLLVDDREHWLPLATTEGALIASVNRGCKLLHTRQCRNEESQGRGARTIVRSDAMTRGPVITASCISEADAICRWIESSDGFAHLKEAFDGTSAHARLRSISTRIVGRRVFLRFGAETGEAMGMNMLGKGCEAALSTLLMRFHTASLTSLSGNYCSDKKTGSQINWQVGRGKHVIAEAVLSRDEIQAVLKCTMERLLEVYQSKCLIGSSLAGCGGPGSNAHAANIVAAIFAATGQDLAQIGDSSACMTLLEKTPDDHLHASVSMPCLHVGTVGGGTRLPPQSACIDLMLGPSQGKSESRAVRLARVLAAAVLAGELSLLGSLAEGSLMRAHLQLNRPPQKEGGEPYNCC